MKMVSFANPAFLAAWAKIFNEKKELSPKLAYKAGQIHEYLNTQNKKFHQLRDAILKKYGNKDDKGELIIKDGNIEFKTECLEDVNREFAELTELVLEPAPPGKINLSELEKDSIKLSGPDVMLLSDLLNFEDEAKPALSLVPPTK